MYKSKRRLETMKKTAKTVGRKTRNSRKSRDHDIVQQVNNKPSKRRITVPLTFFANGIKSQTIQREKVKASPYHQEEGNFLEENLHDLLQIAPNVDDENSIHFTSSTVQPNEQSTSNSCSIFKEINYHYKKLIDKENHNTASNTFCNNLQKELYYLPINTQKKHEMEIKNIVLKINKVIEGKESSDSFESKTVNRMAPKTLGNIPSVNICHLLPKSKWSYHTPSNPKLYHRTIKKSPELKSFWNTENEGENFKFSCNPVSLGISQKTSCIMNKKKSPLLFNPRTKHYNHVPQYKRSNLNNTETNSTLEQDFPVDNKLLVPMISELKEFSPSNRSRNFFETS